MEAHSSTPASTTAVKREIADITASNGTSVAEATDDRSPPSKRPRTDDSGTEARGPLLKSEPLTNGQGTGTGNPGDDDDYGLDLSEDESHEKDKENAHRKNHSGNSKGVNGGVAEIVDAKVGDKDEKADIKDGEKPVDTEASVKDETVEPQHAQDDKSDAITDTPIEANEEMADDRDRSDRVSHANENGDNENENENEEDAQRSVSESSEVVGSAGVHKSQEMETQGEEPEGGEDAEIYGDGDEHTANGVSSAAPSESHMSDGNLSDVHTDARSDVQPSMEPDHFDEDGDIDVKELRFKSLDGIMRTLWKNGDAWPFHLPVDDVALKIPDYYKIITRPMDMTQISNKLKERIYESVDAFQDDFELMFRNCRMYNKPESDIARMVGNLETAFHKQMDKMPSDADLIAKHRVKLEKKNTKRAVKKATKTRTKGAARALTGKAPGAGAGLTANKISVMKLKERQTDNTAGRGANTSLPMSRTQSVDSFGVRRTSRMSLGGIEPASDINLYERALDNRPARDRRAVVPLVAEMEINLRHKLTVQLKYCGKILTEFLHKKYYPRAWPFVVPVDPELLMLPDYFKIIKKPMDLSTMQKKYDNREYASAEDFANDMRLMFANCYRYNKPGQDVYELGKKLSVDFEQRFARKPDEPIAPPKTRNKLKHAQGTSHSVGGGATHRQRQEYYEDEFEEDEDEAEEAPFRTQAELDHVEQLRKMQEMVATLQSNIEALTRTTNKQASSTGSRRSGPATGTAARKGKQAAPSRKSTSTNNSKVTNTHHAPAAMKRAPLPKPQPPAVQGKPKEDTKPMTFMEKKTLSLNINRLPGSRIAKLVSIIQTCIPELANCPAEELEIDIDSLDPLTLRELEKYVNSAMAEPSQPPKKPAAKRAPARRKAIPKKQAQASGSGSQARGNGGAHPPASRGAGSGYLSESQRMRRGGSSSSSSSDSSSGSSSSDSSGSDSESEAEVTTSSRSRGTGGKGGSRPSSATGTKSGSLGAPQRRASAASASSMTKPATSNTSPAPGINAGIQLAPGPPPKPKESKLLLGEAARTSQAPRTNALKMVPSASKAHGVKPGSKPAIKVGNVNAWSSLATGGGGVASSGNTPRGTSPATGNSPASRIGNSVSPADGSGDRLNEYRKKALLKSTQEKLGGGELGGMSVKSGTNMALSRNGSMSSVGVSGRSPISHSGQNTNTTTKHSGSADESDSAGPGRDEAVADDQDDRAKRREEERRRRAQEANQEQSTAAHDAISGEALEESLFMFG
ncbi:hypothetical protein SARC_06858 [Sphaeroforma arctica JP610]|uniref:Bromo domain-containing protein n=1 Tax=Sphaeroforma arctica JP610 TaxID=667725 RepID=A0A0L0FVB2_9EUKA|nr:hypothetical protein SARC_06858 [Sphaeroforma arctica JP610]KNC80795.1 hypothetical protein SARC_06858 [Sphaeroforma arctica JP610]|eukprot:XP_014154697.1 hypothetical protein SARC_06858 [Sphaeroforma arctica JP610]